MRGVGAGGRVFAGSPLLENWEGRSAEGWAGRLRVATVEFHARIGSTGDRARELVAEGWPRPAVVVAERQSAGRGRRGRSWVSDTPLGLWFTLAADADAEGTAALPLRVGLGVARGLEALVPGMRIEVKWPNDLLAGGKKLGGVLCEQAGGAILAGVGLNLNHALGDLPAGLETPATSVRVASGLRVSRGRALARIIDELPEVWARLGRPIPAAELAELEARSPLLGRRLAVDGVVRHSSERPRAVTGLPVTGGNIRPDGTLEVRDDTGTRLRVMAGSIRANPGTSRS